MSVGVPIVLLYPGVIYGPGKVTAGNVVAKMVLFYFFFFFFCVLFSHMLILKLDHLRLQCCSSRIVGFSACLDWQPDC